jgi:argininosuccinate lyase
LKVFKGMLKTAEINRDKMALALDQGYLLATDIADYLVGKGETFRGAHEITGRLVSWAVKNNKSFAEINLSDYRSFSKLFEDDVYLITIDRSLSARNNPGGTAPDMVKQALAEAKRYTGLKKESSQKRKISGKI